MVPRLGCASHSTMHRLRPGNRHVAQLPRGSERAKRRTAGRCCSRCRYRDDPRGHNGISLCEDARMNTRIAPGTILAGKYRVEGVLGSGGMGMVVAAHHLQLDERVAIKVLLPQMLENSEATARFSREARAAVKIKSEYVARVIDVGSLESGHPYMVMEYLEGEDLADMLSRGPLPREQAVELVLQACEALCEAHALGIIHRDIKPANFYCVRRTDGLLAMKLLDFGISRATGGAELALTSSGAVMG